MQKIVSTINLEENYVEKIKDLGLDYKFVDKKEMTKEDVKDADIFNTYGSDLNDSNKDDFENLKWVNVMSAGVDNIPKEIFDKAIVTNASGIHKVPMSEYAIGLLLSYYKQLYTAYEAKENHEWISFLKSEELYRKTAIILGTGQIASQLAFLLQAFQVKVIGFNTSGRNVDNFDETYNIDDVYHYLPEADIVVNILPSTESTRGLIDKKFFETMNEEAVFMNIGRGDITTDDTLLYALDNKLIRHMLLDVFNDEPLSSGSPFFKYENITITPHASAKTSKYVPRAFELFEMNLQHYLNNEDLINAVAFSKGY